MARILLKVVATTLCLVVLTRFASAQTGLQADTLAPGAPQPLNMKPLVIAGSERVLAAGKVLSDSLYRIDYRNGALWLLEPRSDTVIVQYRTYPFAFRESYYRRSVASPVSDSVLIRDISEVSFVAPEEAVATDQGIFGDTKLERHGSISRGIIAGNNRSVSLESGLRIQLAGEITEGVSVRAVLTDENTPIQPDGTTQRLSEFDRVFIELETRRGSATLGDYDLRFGASEFGVLNRKLLGISVTGNPADPYGTALGPTSVTVAGAASRGIFNSMNIVPLEGVQGPYRLRGREGERFIIVVAGSERVYWDGVLIERGEQNDYVIDYTTGELTFTSNRIVSDDRRIVIEFEYTTSRYTRSLIATEAQTSVWQREDGSSRARFGVTFIQESDSKTFTDATGISAADSMALADAGDGLAVVGGGELVPFDPEAGFVQYVREDTLFADSVYSYFAPVTDTASVDSVYRVRFTQVPFSDGDYVRRGQSLNGIVFDWVGPGQGDYVAVRVLPKPAQQRMLDLNGAFEPVKGVEVFGEWAQSMYDQNRFSSLDSDDDDGGAYTAGFRIKPIEFELGALGPGRLTGGLRHRRTDENFESFDRIRPVEFRRRWNVVRPVNPTGSTGSDEDVTESFVDLAFSQHSLLRAEVGRLELGDGFQGRRLAFEGFSRQPLTTQAGYRIEAINSTDSLLLEKGSWIRQLGSLAQPISGGRLTPGIEIEHEDRQQRDLDSDSLTLGSERFVEIRPTVAYTTNTLTASALFEYRSEDGLDEGTLVDRADSYTAQAKLSFRQGRNFTTEADVGYRTKHFSDRFIARGSENAESVAIRWTSRIAGWRRAVQTNLYYQALTERTPLLQETYVRTGTEIGQYVWEDTNGDGIRQVDEFIPERTPYEGTYVRTFIPSDDLESVINVQARMRLTVDPRLVFRGAESLWKRILSRVTSQTVLEVADKSTEPDNTSMYFLDLSKFRNPGTTLSGRLRVEQRLEFFKGLAKYGGTLTFANLESLSRLSAGYEERARTSLRGTGRYQLARRASLAITTFVENNRSTSSEFTSRQFDIDAVNVEPELSLSPLQAMQLSLSASFASKVDHSQSASGVERTARIWKFPVRATYALAQKLQVSGRFEVASVDLSGDAVGYAEFELTDGRGPGTSFLWTINGSYAVTSLIRASLSYDGRAPSDAPSIHTVRTQFSLVF